MTNTHAHFEHHSFPVFRDQALRDRVMQISYAPRTTISSTVMKLSIPLFTIVLLCLHLSQRQHSAQGDEGSNGSPLQSANVLLLYSGQEEAAKWFRVSSGDALVAARLACRDIAINDSLLISVEIVVNLVLCRQ